MAHALGAVYDTPHGVANAILLPTVMEFNADACSPGNPKEATKEQIIALYKALL